MYVFLLFFSSTAPRPTDEEHSTRNTHKLYHHFSQQYNFIIPKYIHTSRIICIGSSREGDTLHDHVCFSNTRVSITISIFICTLLLKRN